MQVRKSFLRKSFQLSGHLLKAWWMLALLLVLYPQIGTVKGEATDTMASALPSCPKPSSDLKTGEGGAPAILKVVNNTPLRVLVYWINDKGSTMAQPLGVVNGHERHRIETFQYHSFRIYMEGDHEQQVLVQEYQVAKPNMNAITFDVHSLCRQAMEMVESMQQQKASRADEFEALVHSFDAPCLPADDSTQWSCIRYLSANEYKQRLANEDPNHLKFGFNSTQEAQTRKVGDTADRIYSRQIPLIPRVAPRPNPGYLKMTFSQTLHDLLLKDFYPQHKKGGPQDAVTPHRVIPGGFTNSHTVPMSQLSLDRFPHIKARLDQELQAILEWWTQQPLVATSTFGIRIYHRDSMLINHVDRAETHLASAVIQVDQQGMDEGWPLEILHADGTCAEVYLQPGELVLYEGARFMHGRPMRMAGQDFANVFAHFRPVDWLGPGKSSKYDRKLDKEGYLAVESSDESKGNDESSSEL